MISQEKYFIGPALLGNIRRVITRVDGTPYETSGKSQEVRFMPEIQQPPTKVFRICTFTGTWNIDTDRVVTFRGVTTTPNTVLATNLFADVGGGGTATSNPCAIGRDGTAWYLIAARCTATCTNS